MKIQSKLIRGEKMDSNKPIFIMLLMVFSLILMMSLATALITVDYPVASQSINGTRTINFTTSPGEQNYTNASLSFACTSPVTGASSGNISSGNNQSAGDTNFNISWNTAVITGDCTGTLTVTTKNMSNVEETATVTGIIIDNTENTISFAGSSPASSQTTSLEEGTFSITTSEATAGATLYLGSRTYSMTGANDTWAYTFSKSAPNIPEGIYIAYYIQPDGTGANDDGRSAYRDIWVDYEDSNGDKLLVYQTDSSDSGGGSSTSKNGMLVFLILIGAGYFVFLRK